MINGSHTYKEIMNQVKSWEMVHSDIIEKKINLNYFSNNYDEIIFFGCGTSYNIAQSASFYTKTLMSVSNCKALPSSELLINTDTYINKGKKYLIIGFSRSGETTESINVGKKLKELKNIQSLTFSCRKESTISSFSDNHFICRGAFEKGIAMTVSFSSMLFAYCLMFAKFLNNREMLKEFQYLIEYMNGNIANLFNDVEKYLRKTSFSSYFALGTGFNYGLAVEADLKMKEMTQIPSYSYYLHEFNHGPKSLLNKESLCLILTLDTGELKNEIIIEEILRLDSKVLIIGGNNIKSNNSKNLEYLLCDSKFNFNLIKSFINIPVFQILAYVKTIMENLDPDKPKNLNYTMKI